MNYQLECDKIINEEGRGRRLLLHSCCAPCSSYVLTYLREYFDITVLYYNPNITEEAEYGKRKEEELRLIRELNKEYGYSEQTDLSEAWPKGYISFMDCDYDAESFYEIAKGYEDCPEGGDRCGRCFALRLGFTAQRAKEENFDFFTTTLSISPLKNAERLNKIGESLATKVGVRYLYSDFKKRDGYKKSTELSAKYGLYRQNYCGCVYSIRSEENSSAT